MPEITIQSPEDIKKLGGWQIKQAVLEPNLNGLCFTLTHIAAEKAVKLTIFPSVNFQIVGNSVTAHPALSLRTEDAII